MARTALKVFRVKHKLTQGKMAARIGCNRGTYAAIENGGRNGRTSFWLDLKAAFPDAILEELMKVDEE